MVPVVSNLLYWPGFRQGGLGQATPDSPQSCPPKPFLFVVVVFTYIYICIYNWVVLPSFMVVIIKAMT